MPSLTEISAYTDSYLHISEYADFCPNGLQVEGKASVYKIASGVTASLAFIERAHDWGADCLLVHHGYFWKNERPQVVGMKKNRLRALLQADISLLAYHLPLDAHPVVGNNVQLAQRLGLSDLEPLQKNKKSPIGNVGRLDTPVTAADFVKKCAHSLARAPLHIDCGPDPVQTVAWCTGAAQNMIEDAVACHAEVYLTGEVSEQTVHIARENHIHFISAGHHATERYGVQALGAHLAEKFGLQHRFFDVENPA